MTSVSNTEGSALIGRVVAGRYQIEKKIARGGMGVVYLAEHLRLQRPVVFKVLSEHLADDNKATARFEQEALGLSKLNHPNVVSVYDFGIEEGLTYIVMEFVPGATLTQVLRDGGVMSFERLLPLAGQIVEAIGAAHDQNIVHRDIKPANIMVVSQDGRPDLVKVLDFGLARLTSSSLDITKDNLVGTVSYVAPEVVKGARAGKAADVYALGVMFYFMLTGRKPFKADDDLGVLYKHVHDAPTPLDQLLHEGHDVPEGFIALIHRCLAKDPTDRPADALALLTELSEVVTLPTLPRMSSGEFVAIQRARVPDISQAVAIEPVSPIESMELTSVRLRDQPNSRWGIPLIALAVFVAGVGALLLFTDTNGEASQADEPAPETTTDDTLSDVEPVEETFDDEALDPATIDEDESDDSTASGQSDNSEAPTRADSLERETDRADAPRKTDKVETARSEPSPETDAGNDQAAKGEKDEKDQPESTSVPTIDPDDEAGLLEVDSDSDSILLPVD